MALRAHPPLMTPQHFATSMLLLSVLLLVPCWPRSKITAAEPYSNINTFKVASDKASLRSARVDTASTSCEWVSFFDLTEDQQRLLAIDCPSGKVVVGISQQDPTAPQQSDLPSFARLLLQRQQHEQDRARQQTQEGWLTNILSFRLRCCPVASTFLEDCQVQSSVVDVYTSQALALQGEIEDSSYFISLSAFLTAESVQHRFATGLQLVFPPQNLLEQSAPTTRAASDPLPTVQLRGSALTCPSPCPGCADYIIESDIDETQGSLQACSWSDGVPFQSVPSSPSPPAPPLAGYLPPNTLLCPSNQFVVGVECRGKNCDQLRMICCSFGKACPPGFYGDNINCQKCPPGRYGSAAGMGSPFCSGNCMAGYYGNKAGQTKATCSGSCPIGTYSNDEGLTSAEECEPCPKGTYGLGCRNKCPQGYYSDVEGAISPRQCKPCPSNTYGKKDGLTSSQCTQSCPVGRYSTVVSGSTSETACAPCPDFYTNPHASWACRQKIAA